MAAAAKAIGAPAVQTQETLASRIAIAQPSRERFVKDAPVLAYRITSAELDNLPEPIRTHLGEVDTTQYTDGVEGYLGQNIGSVIVLQMNGDQPDFYIVLKANFDSDYRSATVGDVRAKNAKVFGRVAKVEGMQALIDSGDSNVVGALKTVPVSMVRMSDIGYPVGGAVIIQSPWGQQTKPADNDAFLVWDKAEKQFYMVNADDSGLPIAYVPAAVRP